MAIRVLLVDDHPLVRQGLRALLACDQAVEVVREAGNGAEGVRLAGELRPDIVLMDMAMPEMDGTKATRILRAELPDVKVIAVTQHTDKPALDAMLMAGASGFVVKTCSAAELSQAVQQVMRGEAYLSPDVVRVFVSGYVDMVQESQKPHGGNLTSGEIEVLKLLADGKSVKEIAAQLEISAKTADGRRRKLMLKLGMSSVADLVKYAIRQGITDASR